MMISTLIFCFFTFFLGTMGMYSPLEYDVPKIYNRGQWNLEPLLVNPIHSNDYGQRREIKFKWVKKYPRRNHCLQTLIVRAKQGLDVHQSVPLISHPIRSPDSNGNIAISIDTSSILNSISESFPKYVFFEVASLVCRKVYAVSMAVPLMGERNVPQPIAVAIPERMPEPTREPVSEPRRRRVSRHQVSHENYDELVRRLEALQKSDTDDLSAGPSEYVDVPGDDAFTEDIKMRVYDAVLEQNPEVIDELYRNNPSFHEIITKNYQDAMEVFGPQEQEKGLPSTSGNPTGNPFSDNLIDLTGNPHYQPLGSAIQSNIGNIAGARPYVERRPEDSFNFDHPRTRTADEDFSEISPLFGHADERKRKSD